MKTLQTRTHLLSGASLTNLVFVLFKNRSEISPKYLPQVLLIFITPLLLFPLYLCELIFFSARISRIRVKKDPVFIIGHFRSGTTFMHNLLGRDSQFGFPTTYQCFVPGIFLTGKQFIKAVHKTTQPEKRPMDDAKFIYMHRNTQQILKSTNKLFDRFLKLYSFQDISANELQNNISWVFDQMISEYNDQKKLIPKHHLIEIDYDDFIREPLKTMQKIYSGMQLEGFETAKNDFEKYILEQASYTPDLQSLTA